MGSRLEEIAGGWSVVRENCYYNKLPLLSQLNGLMIIVVRIAVNRDLFLFTFIFSKAFLHGNALQDPQQ